MFLQVNHLNKNITHFTSMSAICPTCIFSVVTNMSFIINFTLENFFGKMDWVRTINVRFTKFWLFLRTFIFFFLVFLRTFNAFNVDPNFLLPEEPVRKQIILVPKQYYNPFLIDLVKNLIQYSNILNNKVIHLVVIVYSIGYFTITNGAT